MSFPASFSILALWLARAGANDAVQERFFNNPLAFSSWYALTGEAVEWPESAQAVIKTEKNKKISLERASSLLSKLNHALKEQVDLDQARRILTGYALQEWAYSNAELFIKTLKDHGTKMEALKSVLELPSEEDKLQTLCNALELGDLDRKLLTLTLVCSISREFQTLLDQLFSSRKLSAVALWECVLGCKQADLLKSLSPQSSLRKSQILKSYSTSSGLPSLSQFWVDVLLDPMDDLFERLLKPLSNQPGAGLPARLAEDDLALASQMLVAPQAEKGVNLLLYGADGLEKRTMLQALLHKSGKEGYVLQDPEGSWRDTGTLAYVAQRLLFLEKGSDAVLVIEKPADVLERKPSSFIRMMFGIELDPSHIAPFDELMLSSNPAPCVWTGQGADALPEECVARFVFHAPLKKARREERRAQLEQSLSSMKLTQKTQKELLTLEDISALQLQTAMRAATLSGATSKKEREAYLVQAVKRSLKALSRDTSPKTKDCVTEYSLKYVNHAGRFGPEQILKALKLRPKGSLCLYGPPGTGKTQFVEYLAAQLGVRLTIKRASDLLSKWVGESEQNIAKMFAEAENEESMLFLDEGDSFLRDRSLAQHSWEVTKVNELLQHMERFPGIFVVATNLFRGLDAAALRRFTFKLEFCALNADQRWEMFVNETGLKGKLSQYPQKLREDWWESLCFMPQLTAGDFATVKRQCLLLGESLSPQEWLAQLKIECDVKSENRLAQEGRVQG